MAKVFLTQAVAQLLVSASIQLAAARQLPPTRRRWLNPAGIAVMVAGAVVEAASAPGLWTAPAPVAMNYLLVYATGAKRTEGRMQDRPAYRDFQRRVAFFSPRPPKST